MKNLTALIFIISSLTGFAQEKGAGFFSECTLNYAQPNGIVSFCIHEFQLNVLSFSGAFQLQLSDSIIYEITLPIGDSLTYAGSYSFGHALCSLIELEDMDSVILTVGGEPFSVVTEPINNSWGGSSYLQRGIITEPCLIKIEATYSSLGHQKKHFLRVKFVEPTLPVPGVPDISKDIYILLTDENTLFIEADEHSILNTVIYSLSGQLVEKRIIEGQQNLDISSFSKGCYIVQVTDETGAEKRLKFVK